MCKAVVRVRVRTQYVGARKQTRQTVKRVLKLVRVARRVRTQLVYTRIEVSVLELVPATATLWLAF